MPLEELDLVSDNGLMLGAVVDVEVIDAWISSQLPQWRPASGPDRNARCRHPVGLADANQPGAMKAASMPNVVEGERRSEKPARRGAVTPAGVLADGDDMLPAGFAAGSIDEGGIARLTEGRQVPAADRGGDHPRLDAER